jgi:hypothetical protein
MVCFRRLCMSVGVAAALTVFAAPASAQVTYALAGVEIAAQPTVGTFVGVAWATDDFGKWEAEIHHGLLADVAAITGGGFRIDGKFRQLLGFILPGGTITRLGGSCRKETFAVEGDVLLGDLLTPGEFDVTLTHYGFRMPGGGCVTFFATVDGQITFPTLQ